MNDTFTCMYVTGQHKNKAGLRQTWVYNPFASTQIWSIYNSYVSKMCKKKIVGFWIRACWICAKYAKINVLRIFPLLQYRCLHSNSSSVPHYERNFDISFYFYWKFAVVTRGYCLLLSVEPSEGECKFRQSHLWMVHSPTICNEMSTNIFLTKVEI